MAKKKTSKIDGESKPKVKGLFDHINHIREGRNPKYFETLSEADQKSWSNYMVCRFLSMDIRCIDMINEIQKYQSLQPKEFYQLCLAVTPKGRAFFPYIKNQSEDKWSKEVMEILCKHFQESERNVVEYLQIITKDEVRKILSLYGHNEKDIKNLLDE